MGGGTTAIGFVFLSFAAMINCTPLIVTYLATDGNPYSPDYQTRVRDWLGLPYKHIVDDKMIAARNKAFDDMIRVASGLCITLAALFLFGLYGMYEASSQAVAGSIHQASVKEEVVLHMETLHKENRLNQNQWQVAASQTKAQQAIARKKEMDDLAKQDGFDTKPSGGSGRGSTFEVDT